MNWMLVLFMGLSPNYSVVKTDLVFSKKSTCFGFAENSSKESSDAINKNISELSAQGASQETINRSITWTGMQMPSGTCIPTTLSVTVK